MVDFDEKITIKKITNGYIICYTDADGYYTNDNEVFAKTTQDLVKQLDNLLHPNKKGN